MILVNDPDFRLHLGDAFDELAKIDDGAADACVTSPPYLDARPEYPSPTLLEFGAIFEQLRRVVTGPALVNVGRIWRDGIELRWWEELLDVARMTGWQLLDTRIWIKPNANPIRGQVFADSHEYVFVLGDPGLELNVDPIRTEYAPESIRRLERKWTFHVGVKGGHVNDAVARERTVGAHERGARPRSYHVAHVGKDKGNPHPAPMPLEVAEWMVQLGAPAGGVVVDPFAGSGTTALAARKHGRSCIAIERDPDYAGIAASRLQQLALI